jgi:phosphoenolpyruvate carboxylase
MKTSEISPLLRELVNNSVKLLGFEVKIVYGKKTYDLIEDLRLAMKEVRAADAQEVHKALEKTYQRLRPKKTSELSNVCKAFSLMLELINACEAAYRTHRLKDKKFIPVERSQKMIFVFTGHPTEARSPQFLYVMDKVFPLLCLGLEDNFEVIQDKLSYYLSLALKTNFANNKRPQVRDEAHQIYHQVLNPAILEEQVTLFRQGLDVYFRTWIGGDKDGHPRVNAQTMLESLSLSRNHLIAYIERSLQAFELDLLNTNGPVELLRAVKIQLNLVSRLKVVKARDGQRVKSFKDHFQKVKELAEKNHYNSMALQRVEDLLWLYPALVLPLELREDHDLIHQALGQLQDPISQMLKQLKEISLGFDSKWYVRGLVISMCQSAQDFIAGITLVKKRLGGLHIPVVPLFENEKGLKGAVAIIEQTFELLDLVPEHSKKWEGRFEIMLGYSDSSKENGVLPGRYLVAQAINDLEKCLKAKNLTPVFFHGSGGSTSRGGGSIKEQVAWLPDSALAIYKVTIQGESVQRNFYHPLILRSQVQKIADEFKPDRKYVGPTSQIMNEFTELIQRHYRELLQDVRFHALVSKATPYDFLNQLKIGSRPTKRAGKGQFSLRAIPWILCWTQTRLLLPIWWGVGSAWEGLSHKKRKELIQEFKRSSLFQTYVKNLGFTLEKIELGVWRYQVCHSNLDEDEKDYWIKHFEQELLAVDLFFKEITGGESFTWFNPRLGQSIYFRSSMIHPLNVLQTLALERKDPVLLRETVTGIACGMLTTG